MKGIFRITLDPGLSTVIPYSYQYHLSSFLYRTITAGNPEVGKHIHTVGYSEPENNHSFRPFTFSWLQGKKKATKDNIQVSGKIHFFFSTPFHNIATALSEGLRSQKTLTLGKTDFGISDVSLLPLPEVETDSVRLSTLSPIMAKDKGSVFLRYAEDPKTFSERVRDNLQKKHNAFFGIPPCRDDLKLTFDEDTLRSVLVDVKGIHHVGYMGNLQVEGSPELIWLGCCAGFGERTSSGFGMVKML